MIWWIIATLCAFFVKGLCGFANTLVFTSILSFGNSNVDISPVELLIVYPSNAIIAWKERKSIRWSIAVPLTILVLAGTIPGIIFLKNADVSMLKSIFGIIIVIIGIEMLLREYGKLKIKESKLLVTVIGLLSGVLCGLYGVGALLGAYLSRVTKDSKEFKANICIVFLVENTFRIILYIVYGIITLDVCRKALMLAPFMLAGLGLGILSGKFLNEKIVKKLVIIVLIISGIALVVM